MRSFGHLDADKRSIQVESAPMQTFLYEQDHRKLVEIIARLQMDTSAQAVFLFDRNGQQIALHGTPGQIDMTSFATLTAGNVAATEGLARLVGEREFPGQFHEGLHNHIYVATVGRKAILVVLFDERSSVGLVRLRVKRAMGELVQAFNEIAGRLELESEIPSVEESPEPVAKEILEITDEDIESLFH
jgi:predicted regulator of Ras-like GTPase activity (Roadblock/LC7/MglB family)